MYISHNLLKWAEVAGGQPWAPYHRIDHNSVAAPAAGARHESPRASPTRNHYPDGLLAED